MSLKKNNAQINKGVLTKTLAALRLEEIQHPIFCFKYLHKDFHIDACTIKEKSALIERIVKLSAMSWINIQEAPKHGLGSEKIAITAIKAPIPHIITEDMNFLLALRFFGKAAFIGLRNKFIFM